MGLHYRNLFSYAFRGRFNSKTGQESISWLPNWLRRNPSVRLVPHAQKPVLRRLYHVDKNNVHHFKSRGLKWWIRHPMDVITIALLGGCVLYVTNLQTVPYSNRRRVVLIPSGYERWIGEKIFKWGKSEEYEGKILPPSHPDDVRVQKIAKDIIGAARRELRQDHHRGSQTAHVEEFKWEVIVVDNPINNAYCFPGGKIVLNTGLLRASKSDDEIAATIGHEVGHAVARHHAECTSRDLLAKLIFKNFMSAIVFKISYHFLELSHFRGQEREADYIGLLLSACAGYDPVAAPQKWERSAKNTRTRKWFQEYDRVKVEHEKPKQK